MKLPSNGALQSTEAGTTKAITQRSALSEDADKIVGFNVAMARKAEDKILNPDITGRGARALHSGPQNSCY